MILVSTDGIPGKELEHLGLVKESTIQTVNAVRDIIRFVFSDPEIVLDYKCDRCGYKIHFERSVVVE